MMLPPHVREFYRKHPINFVREIIGADPDKDQCAVLNSLRDNPRTTWRTGHGVGKTADISWAILWWTYCFDPSLALVTAPTRDQLYDVLWTELSKWKNKSLVAPDVNWTATGLWINGAKDTQRAQARTSNNPQALAGRHEENVLIVVEEASAVPQEIFAPMEGSLTAKHARFIMIGNPTQTQGEFYESFHRDAQDYARFHTSAEHHPRVAQHTVERIIRKYGRQSDYYRVRVAGEFPEGDPGTFITLPRVDAAMAREVPPFGDWALGVDCAGMGDDRMVQVPGRGLHIGSDIRIYQHVRSSGDAANHVMRQVRELRKDNAGPVVVAIDGGGLGWGPAGDLAQIANDDPSVLRVVSRNFGGGGDGEFDNEASWMWGKLRDSIDTMQLPRVENLAEEIAHRHYELVKGKIKIEPKAKYKERHKQSPDIADALVLLMSVYGWQPEPVLVFKARAQEYADAR